MRLQSINRLGLDKSALQKLIGTLNVSALLELKRTTEAGALNLLISGERMRIFLSLPSKSKAHASVHESAFLEETFFLALPNRILKS